MRFFSFVLLFCSFVSSILAQNNVPVSGNISSNTTWTNNNQYILSEGFHYITDNATLAIEPGTIIKSIGGSLIVTRGAKLMADGTPHQPIVFTSAKTTSQRVAGDWGGIALLGKAPINDIAGERLLEGGLDATLGLYGGTDAVDNSGILRYVRIEFAGLFYIANNELNALTFGGVGSGTTVENIMVFNGNDDSFEWFGGTVNAKNLVSYHTLDDDFDTDYGYTGQVQYGLIVRDPSIADVSRSNMFESDNDATGTLNTPFTNATFSNVTALGPIQSIPANVINSNFGRALHLRRSTDIDIVNSVFAGYPTGLMLDGANSINGAINGTLRFDHNIMAGITGLVVDTVYPGTVTAPAFDPTIWFAANSNQTLTSPTDLGYADPYNTTSPDFSVVSGAALLNQTTDFDGLGSYFTATDYVGAFGADIALWTNCWTEFAPETQAYNSAISYIEAEISAGSPFTIATAATNDIQWYENGVAIAGANESTYMPANTGDVYAMVSNARGCVLQTNTIATATNEIFTEGSLVLVPNPASLEVQIKFEWNRPATEVNMTLVNTLGQVIYSSALAAQNGQNKVMLATNTYPRGTYHVVFSDGVGVSSATLLLK
jgi:Secretion system C-terminal sorting domain